jgi:predicted N-acetyltransferase YhbS
VTGPGLRLARLEARHQLDGFDSGNEVLDSWLKRHALAAQQMDTARTFVLVSPDGAVVGYFSLTMGAVLRQDAPAKLVRGLPSYPVGMVLLARLAVDRRHQRSGRGGLLAEALRKAVAAGEAAAARLVVVDAIDDDTVRFYARHGFSSLPENPRRLFRRMKDIRASLEP